MKNNFLQSSRITKRYLTVQNKKQTIAYIYILLTLAAISFFGFFALRPAFSIIANLQKQLSDNRVVLNALSEKLSALVNLDKEYKEIEPNLEVVYEAIPSSPQAAPLVRQIEKIAQSHSLTLNSLETGVIEDLPSQDDKVIKSFTITINAQGTEANIQAFLQSLISFNRVIGLNRISTDKNQDGQVQAVIEGVAYFLPNPN